MGGDVVSMVPEAAMGWVVGMVEEILGKWGVSLAPGLPENSRSFAFKYMLCTENKIANSA